MANDKKKLLYPEGILVYEIIKDKKRTMLIEWTRGGNGKGSKHNGQNLLDLNLCIYELHKFSCRTEEVL